MYKNVRKGLKYSQRQTDRQTITKLVKKKVISHTWAYIVVGSGTTFEFKSEVENILFNRRTLQVGTSAR